MVDKDKIIKVTNRDKGSVGYIIPDLGNLNRQFQPGETKDLTFEELQKLSWIPGGMYMLQNCLVLDDAAAVEELLGEVEPEYYYVEKNVKYLLQYGTLDEFLDCLDFAPAGVLDMIKDLAVELPLNDVQKREVIRDKLGFDVDFAVEMERNANEGSNKEHENGKRRAAVPKMEEKKEEKAPARRVVKVIEDK